MLTGICYFDKYKPSKKERFLIRFKYKDLYSSIKDLTEYNMNKDKRGINESLNNSINYSNNNINNTFNNANINKIINYQSTNIYNCQTVSTPFGKLMQ